MSVCLIHVHVHVVAAVYYCDGQPHYIIISLARPFIAIAREGLASETSCMKHVTRPLNLAVVFFGFPIPCQILLQHCKTHLR